MLAKAYHFAAVRHVAQRRKGEAAEPYMNHLTEVAELVAEATDAADVELIVAAVLHDVLEDTDTTQHELQARFGARVASLVGEVTDDKSLPPAERKRLQIEAAPHASDGAKLIKLADKTANLRALAASPPLDWDAARRLQYVEWSRRVAAGCSGVNDALENGFLAAAAAVPVSW